MSNHKWDENNNCIHCGLHREMKSWKLLMAMVGCRDYYQYGRNWHYGKEHKFQRPECKKLKP